MVDATSQIGFAGVGCRVSNPSCVGCTHWPNEAGLQNGFEAHKPVVVELVAE